MRGLQASREMSARLSVAARKLRFSTSSRSGLYQAVGLRPRLVDRIFTAVVVVITILCLVVPNGLAIAYFGFLASDQYQSEARFTVRSSTPALGRDQLAKVTGMPAAKIVQDTQIVINLISSHEILEMLRGKIDLRSIFGGTSIDWWARLPEKATTEEVLAYWEDMVSTSINPSSGIVTLRVRAFKPEDSVNVVRAVLAASETVVNQVNDRIWKDVSSTAQENFDSAKDQLAKTRDALALARNQNGVLSVEGSSSIISNLITTTESEKLKLQLRYNSQSSKIENSAPQMRVLQREIESKEQQLKELNARLAGQGTVGRSLADVSEDLSQLQMAQTLAEQRFASSVKTLEQVKFVSQQQLLYLDSFLPPQLPDEATYPKRMLWISLTLVASFLVWGVALGLLHFARKQLFN